MTEVLGALAAASQLIEQGLKITIFISDLYAKVRDAPESIRKQSVQVKQLTDIARLIKQILRFRQSWWNLSSATVSVEQKSYRKYWRRSLRLLKMGG
jgi:hypothetical protein